MWADEAQRLKQIDTPAVLAYQMHWSASHTTAHKANNTRSFTLSFYASRHAYHKTGHNLPAAVPCQESCGSFWLLVPPEHSSLHDLPRSDHHTPRKLSKASRARTPRPLSFAAGLALLTLSSVLRDCATRESKACHSTPPSSYSITTTIRLASTRLMPPPTPHPPPTHRPMRLPAVPLAAVVAAVACCSWTGAQGT